MNIHRYAPGLISDSEGEYCLVTDVQTILASTYRVYKEGNSWCAIGPGFVNLQESKAGFGDSPLAALGELIVQEGEP